LLYELLVKEQLFGLRSGGWDYTRRGKVEG